MANVVRTAPVTRCWRGRFGLRAQVALLRIGPSSPRRSAGDVSLVPVLNAGQAGSRAPSAGTVRPTAPTTAIVVRFLANLRRRVTNLPPTAGSVTFGESSWRRVCAQGQCCVAYSEE